MKVLGINCSPRKGGNTEILIREVFKALEKEKRWFLSSEE